MTDKTEGTLPADAGSETVTDEDLWRDFDTQDARTDDEADDDNAPGDKAGSGDDDTPADDWAERDEPDTDRDGSAEKDGDTGAAESVDWKARAEKAEQKWRSDRGRVEKMRKEAEALQQELERARQQIAALKTDDEKARDRESRLNKVREEYGDVMEPVLEEIQDLRARDEALTRAEQSRLERLESNYESLVQAEQDAFLAEHKDGFDVIDQNRDAFRAWIDDQPREMRDIFKANEQAIVDGQGAAMMVSRFKAFMQDQSRGPGPASSETRSTSRRKLQLEGARSSRTPGRQAATSDISPDTDDPEALWDYWDRKERQGRR